MNKARVLIAFFVISICIPAHAISDLLSIKDLHEFCSAGDRLKDNPVAGNAIRAGNCLGFIRGVVESHFFSSAFDRTTCLPESFKWSDANQDVIELAKSLRDKKFSNPLDESAAVVISRFLSAKYPCLKK